MSDPANTPPLNLKPRRSATAQSAAGAYGAAQSQAVPGQPAAAPSGQPENRRGFIAANWPLMTAAVALMAGGIVMGMAVGSSGPRPQAASAVAAVAPLPPQPAAKAETVAPAPVPQQLVALPAQPPVQNQRPALAPPPPPADPLPYEKPAAAPEPVMPEPKPAAEPQQMAAAPAPPPALTEQNSRMKGGQAQAWRARAVAMPAGARPPYVAIVIDDAGLDRKNTARAIALPGPVTLSFMSYAGELAEQSRAARAAGHEVMLHLPMEPLDARRNNPGPNALLLSLDTAELQRRLDWALDRFDGYIGVNNHMGSRFTRDEARMGQVMTALAERQVFWLDSLSGPGSAGTRTARRAGLDAVERDLFLDDSRSPGVMHELAAMERIARQRGDVIAIGHPHTTTLNALEKWMAGAKEKGFSLVPVSTVLLRRQQMER